MGCASSTSTSAQGNGRRRRSSTGEQKDKIPTNKEEEKETYERRENQQLKHNIVPEIFTRNFTEFYDVEKKVLGSGISGTVNLCTHKVTKLPFAVKSLTKKNIKREKYEQLKTEIRIMQSLDHPHILRLHECFETDNYIYLVTELCKGGELLDRLQRQRSHHYNERMAMELIFTILSAIKYCHAHKIVHRDLKLENFLAESEAHDSPIKLIDFGLSQHFEGAEGEKMHKAVGTPYYVAPEVLSNNYDAKCDVWSIGVITYMLLSGIPPFNGSNNRELLDKVKIAKWKFDERLFRNVSKDAKDFITKCLTKDPETRPSAEEAIEHAWFQRRKEDLSDVPLDVLDSLSGFGRRKSLSRLCWEIVSYTLQPEQIDELRDAFKKIDVSGSGEISVEDMRTALKEKLNEEEISRIFGDVDFDKSGQITYHEFLAATFSKKKLTESNLRSAFEMISNHNEYFTSSDLAHITGRDVSAEQVDLMIQDAHMNVDKKFDFEDFAILLREGSASFEGQVAEVEILA